MLDSISSFLLLYKIYFLYKNWAREILKLVGWEVGNKYLLVVEIFKIEAARPDKKLKDLRALFQVNLDMVLNFFIRFNRKIKILY